MPKFIQSPAAIKDLFEIFSTIALENPPAAERMVDRFNDVFRRLADHPHLGELFRSSGRRNVRFFPVGNYVVYYQPVEDGVRIVRVWHAARGAPPLL